MIGTIIIGALFNIWFLKSLNKPKENDKKIFKIWYNVKLYFIAPYFVVLFSIAVMDIFAGASFDWRLYLFFSVILFIPLIPIILKIKAPNWYVRLASKIYVKKQKIKGENGKEATIDIPNYSSFFLSILIIIGVFYYDFRKKLYTPESLENLSQLKCSILKKYPDSEIQIDYFNDNYVFIKLTPKNKKGMSVKERLVVKFDALFEPCENKGNNSNE